MKSVSEGTKKGTKAVGSYMNRNNNFSKIKEEHIFKKLNDAEKCLDKDDLEGALIEFNKVLFFEKTIPDVYVEKAEIFIKLCDFSSAIHCFKKALSL